MEKFRWKLEPSSIASHRQNSTYGKTSKNYGMAGAISVVIFIITGLLSMVVFKSLTKQDEE